MDIEPTARTYRSTGRTLWRVLPGLVIIQRIDGELGSGLAELTGLAAQVWLVLGEPASAPEIVDALSSEGIETDPDSLQGVLSELVEQQLIATMHASMPQRMER